MKPEVEMEVSELVERIRTILERSHRVLVVSHIDPDGDAVGTLLAFGHYLKDLGKQVVLARASALPSKYLFLPEVKSIMDINTVDASRTFDAAVVLECPTPDRIGPAAGLISDQTSVINIDHHPANTLPAEVRWVDTEASSVGEMTFEYFRFVDYSIGPEVATQLFTAMLTDTGRFRYSCTGPRTLAIAGELVRAGADPRQICDHVYFEMEPSIIKLTGELLSRLEYHNEGRFCLMALSRDTLERTGADPTDTEGLVDYTLYPRGVEVGVLLRDAGSQLTRVSLRSQSWFDVASVAARLGGGGHTNAAGCDLPLPLDAAKNEIIRLLQEARDTQG